MEKRFMKGNEAIAESAVRAGCRFFAGYPITPQNEIPEYLARRLPEVKGVFVQGESEIASAYMVYGASATGTRSMTSSSGLGLCLKSEAISYLAGARLPAVIVDVSRGGPGLGTIQPAQQDYTFMTKAPGGGGVNCLVYAPATVQEAADLVYKAFDRAERDRNPVIVLADGCLGAMMEAVELPEMKEPPSNKEWSLEKSDRDYRCIASFNLEPRVQEQFNIEQQKMFEAWQKDIETEHYQMDDAEYVLAAYGICGRIAKTAIQELRAKGLKVGLIRPITVNPFPTPDFAALSPEKVKAVLAVEMAIPGQMLVDVRAAVDRSIPVVPCARSGGVLMEETDIIDAVEALAKKA